MSEQTFDTGMVAINYAEWPSSHPPLVFLHGLATRWQIFRPLIPALTDYWQIFALDFRGHGKSGRVEGQYRVSDFVDDTVLFLKDVVRQPAVLFGHSMGGWVAASVAAQHPALVRGIVLADTAIYPDSVPSDEILMTLFGVSAAALRSGSSGAGAWPKSLRELDPDVLTGYIDGKLVQGFDPDTLLPAIQCPVLLLQGNAAQGGLMTDDDVARALPNLRCSTHRQFHDAGHWLHVQDSDVVLTEFSQFARALP